MVVRPCVSCKFHQKSGWLSVRGDVCTNPKCDEKAWTYDNLVTGEATHYERRNQECSLARISPCGSEGRYWELRP